jgi:HK97 gp10 family phage protein
MRLENWHPDLASDEITHECMNRLEKAGKLVAARARHKAPVGEDRPPYKNGKPWTARKAGTLRDSIRVTRLKGDPNMTIRVYAGSRQSDKLTAYYAPWVEFGTSKKAANPFMRSSLNESETGIMSIMESDNG